MRAIDNNLTKSGKQRISFPKTGFYEGIERSACAGYTGLLIRRLEPIFTFQNLLMLIFSEKEQEICAYTGVAGCLITAACGIQHMVIYRVFDFVLPLVMLGIYIISFGSFLMLALHKWYAPICLLVSAVLSLLTGAMAIGGPLISILALIHFLYSATLVIVIYMDQLPARLKQKELALRAEQNEWNGKI